MVVFLIAARYRVFALDLPAVSDDEPPAMVVNVYGYQSATEEIAAIFSSLAVRVASEGVALFAAAVPVVTADAVAILENVANVSELMPAIVANGVCQSEIDVEPVILAVFFGYVIYYDYFGYDYTEMYHVHFPSYFHLQCTSFCIQCDAIYLDPFLRPPEVSCPNTRWLRHVPFS